jgi:hypothetical protein
MNWVPNPATRQVPKCVVRLREMRCALHQGSIHQWLKPLVRERAVGETG